MTVVYQWRIFQGRNRVLWVGTSAPHREMLVIVEKRHGHSRALRVSLDAGRDRIEGEVTRLMTRVRWRDGVDLSIDVQGDTRLVLEHLGDVL